MTTFSVGMTDAPLNVAFVGPLFDERSVTAA